MCDVPTDSSVVLPEGSKRQPYGKVLDVGPDCKFVKVDDKLLFLPGNLLGFEISSRENPVFIVNETCILAKLEMFETEDSK